MNSLFKRSAWVQIGDKRFTGLHLRFKVEKTSKPEPNTLDLYAFNLSAASREEVSEAGKKQHLPITLVAGYEQNEQVIFYGDARSIDHERHGSDWTTHVQCGDSEKAFVETRSAWSFAPGTPVQKVIEKLSADLGVSSKDALKKLSGLTPALQSFLQGFAAQGRTSRELDRVIRAAGLEWSLQDGQLVVLAPGTASDDGAVLLSEKTGLVGSPTHGKPTSDGEPVYLRANSLLNPALRPMRAVKIESRSITGFYRVEKVTHFGELDGQHWYSSIEALPLRGAR